MKCNLGTSFVFPSGNPKDENNNGVLASMDSAHLPNKPPERDTDHPHFTSFSATMGSQVDFCLLYNFLHNNSPGLTFLFVYFILSSTSLVINIIKSLLFLTSCRREHPFSQVNGLSIGFCLFRYFRPIASS